MTASIIFFRGEKAVSVLSRILQISPWDRVAIDFKDGNIFELCRNNGVHRLDESSFYGSLGKHVVMNVTIPDIERCLDYIQDSAHLKYGWLHLLRMPTLPNYNNNHAMPSTFIVEALRAGKMVLDFDSGLITPVRLWLALLSKNSEIKH